MNMKNSVKTCFKKFITIKGRASRSEFWWFILFFFLLAGVTGACLGLLSAILEWDDSFDSMTTSNVGNIVTLVLIFPMTCVSVRRFHDIDKSGWNFLLYYAYVQVPFFIFIVLGDIINVSIATIVCLFIAFVYGTIAIIVFLCKKGTTGDNRFGADPLAEENPH